MFYAFWPAIDRPMPIQAASGSKFIFDVIVA
jgi:hypothetical protein